MMPPKHQWVWLLKEDSNFAVFSNLEKIKTHVQAASSTGTATLYPINMPVYDWAIIEGFFSVKRAEHQAPTFMANFSSASQPHFHFEKGQIPMDEAVDITKAHDFSENTHFWATLADSGNFPSALFDNRELLEAWIQRLAVSPAILDLKNN